jgi:murein DD-endopeptidase MepM/ murein hydrolase activator NlpD
VKKRKLSEIFKGKGYYVLLFVGVLAIGAVAFIGTRLTSEDQDQEENFVDLNEEQDNNIAAEGNEDLTADNNNASEDLVNNGGKVQDDASTQEEDGQDVAVANDELIENDVFSEAEENGIDLSQSANAQDVAADATTGTEEAAVEDEAVETTGKTVQADNSSSFIDNLSFKADDELLWPVNGNVIMNYSMDHTIYYATLMQFRCNPAIIIDAEVGTEVKASADGVVSGIETDEETGLTVTMNIGDGYSLVYGQLKDVTLEVGDVVKEGSVIGAINEPTKYYIVEGSNLYFQVLNNDETVNPMQLLQ